MEIEKNILLIKIQCSNRVKVRLYQLGHAAYENKYKVFFNMHFRDYREEKNNHKAAVLWLTGLSGSGKSTLAKIFVREFFNNVYQIVHLDGDNIRQGLSSDLGFSAKDRTENIRRVGETAKLFFNQGNIVVCSFISPFIKDRDSVRSLFPAGRFIEVYIKCDLSICTQEDVFLEL